MEQPGRQEGGGPPRDPNEERIARERAKENGAEGDYGRDLIDELAKSKTAKQARWWTGRIFDIVRDQGAGYVSTNLKDRLKTLAEKNRPATSRSVAEILGREDKNIPQKEKEFMTEIESLQKTTDNVVTFLNWWGIYYGSKVSLGKYAEAMTYPLVREMTPAVFETITNLDGYKGELGNKQVGKMVNMAMFGFLRVTSDRNKQMVARLREGKSYLHFMGGSDLEKAWRDSLASRIARLGQRDQQDFIPNPFAQDVSVEEDIEIENAIKQLMASKILGKELGDLDDVERIEINEALDWAKKLFSIWGFAAYHGVDMDVNERGEISRNKEGFENVTVEGAPSSDGTIELMYPQLKIKDKKRNLDSPDVVYEPEELPKMFTTHFLRRMSFTDPNITDERAKAQSRRSMWELWIDGDWQGNPVGVGDFPYKKMADEDWRTQFLRIFLPGRSAGGDRDPASEGLLNLFMGKGWKDNPKVLTSRSFFADVRRYIRYTFGAAVVTDGEYQRYIKSTGTDDLDKKLKEESKNLQYETRLKLFGLMWRRHINSTEALKDAINIALDQSRFLNDKIGQTNEVKQMVNTKIVQEILSRKGPYFG